MSGVYDAAVIGAGPSGCAAAAGLARRGMRVVLIEKRAFPRVKACGEFVSPAATDLLESLVPANVLRAAGARRVDLVALEEGDRAIEWRMPTPAWAISRAALDTLLLDAARRSGATALQPVAVREVEYRDACARVALSNGEAIEALAVVQADGAGRFDGAWSPTPCRARVLGVKCHGVPAKGAFVRGVRMRACEGAYLGTVGVEGGLATCAMTVREGLVSRFARDRRYASRDDALDAMTRALWPGFGAWDRTTSWLVTGVHESARVAPGHPRSFRVGNAGGAVEPIGGEGIGLALASGAAMARAFDPRDLARSQRALARDHGAMLRVRRPACRAAAALLMRPALVRAAWPVLASSAGEAFFGAWWTLTGK